jgi:hypothetical protein
MIVSSQVEEAMKNQYLELRSKGVTARSALAARGGNADGDVPCHSLRGHCALKRVGGKRQYVSRLIVAAKTAVQAAHGSVSGQQDGDLAAEADGGLRFGEKPGHGASGRKAELAELSRRILPFHRSRLG